MIVGVALGRAARAQLGRARQQFEAAMPGIKHVRDALMHFDEWARGQGKGPQKKDLAAGKSARAVASAYWGFRYDPAKGTINLGPYVIKVSAAINAAASLADAIYLAAMAVDYQSAAALRDRTVSAITEAGLSCTNPEDVLRVVYGPEPKVWCSLNVSATEDERRDLPDMVVAALAGAGLELLSFSEPMSCEPAERLRAGEALYLAVTAART